MLLGAKRDQASALRTRRSEVTPCGQAREQHLQAVLHQSAAPPSAAMSTTMNNGHAEQTCLNSFASACNSSRNGGRRARARMRARRAQSSRFRNATSMHNGCAPGRASSSATNALDASLTNLLGSTLGWPCSCQPTTACGPPGRRMRSSCAAAGGGVSGRSAKSAAHRCGRHDHRSNGLGGDIRLQVEALHRRSRARRLR